MIENWVGEFTDSFAFTTLPDAVKESAAQVCTEFMTAAGDGPDLQAGFDRLVTLDLPMPVREEMPETIAVFLEWLGTGGRLADAPRLAATSRAMAPVFRQRLAPAGGERGVPVRVAPKIGRNDPCPCGSGRKYKKCCMVR